MSICLHQRRDGPRKRLKFFIDPGLKKSSCRFVYFSDAFQTLHHKKWRHGIFINYFLKVLYSTMPPICFRCVQRMLELNPGLYFLMNRGWTNNITRLLSALKNHQNQVCALYTSTMKLRVIKRCFSSVLLV